MSTTSVFSLDPAEFLKRAGPHLGEDEAENNLLLGIAADLAARPGRPDYSPLTLLIEEDGGFAGAAVMTPPKPLVLSRTGACGIAELVDHLDRAGIRPSGVNGHAGTSRMFAGLWGSRIGKPGIPGAEMRIYEATSARPPAGVAGRLREAVAGDAEALAGWRAGFVAECKLPAESAADSRASVDRLVAARRQFVWDDGGPKCMACWTRPTAHGACISGVYTPPELRRRGYASACAAALTAVLLGSGRRFACLFTDLANPVSNSIYPRIGYRPVCDLASFTFTPGPA